MSNTSNIETMEVEAEGQVAENQATGSETETETDGEEEGEEDEGLNALKTVYYRPAVLAAENTQSELAAVFALCNEHEIEPTMNHDFSEAIPEGYGVAVLPIKHRKDAKEGGGNVVSAVAVTILPDPAFVAQTEAGKNFISQSVIDSFVRRIKGAVKDVMARKDGATLPLSMDSFIAARRASDLMKAWSFISGDLVETLKQAGFKNSINARTLKSVFESAAFAKAFFPRIKQENWEALLSQAAATVAEAGHDPAILRHWLETRDAAEVAGPSDDIFGGILAEMGLDENDEIEHAAGEASAG